MAERQGGKSPEQLRREADEVENRGGGSSSGKDPSRVAGGKRAAATRKEHGEQPGEPKRER